MDTFTWKEILDLLKAYNKAIEAEDEETIIHISNILPDEIKFSGSNIVIKPV